MSAAVHVEVDVANGLIVLTASGALTSALLWEAVEAVQSTEGADPDYDLIFDGSAVEVDHEVDVREISQFEGKLAATDAKLAIVGQDDLHFGIGRMYEAWSAEVAGREMKVFRDLDAAREWILSSR